MADPTVNWTTKVITIPQSFLTFISGVIYELDIDLLIHTLKSIEDSEEGMPFLDMVRHNSDILLGGITYSQTLEIINGYTVWFEDGSYTVRCIGANHNLADVKIPNSVSIIVGNSAGLVTITSGSGLSTEEHDALMAVPDDVWTKTIESTLTAEKILRIALAALAGKRQGLGTALAEYVAQNGTTPRITLDNFDENGNGTPELNGDL